jgi:lysophospholipase
MAVVLPKMSDDVERPESVVGDDGAFLYWVDGMPMQRLQRVFYLSVGLRRNARVRVAHFRPLGTSIGTLVLMHGRAEYIEKYAHVIAHYVKLGFTVVTFDWRGQGLSSRILRDEPRKGHIHDFDAYVRDLQIVIEKGVLPDCPLPLMGLAHSMGGLIALHMLVRKPLWFDRMVLSVPLLRYNVSTASHEAIARGAKWATRFGLGQAFPPTVGETLAGTGPFKDNAVTSDSKRYEETTSILADHPDLGLGGPTFGWLHRVARGMARVWDQEFLDRIKTPCMFVQAGNDDIVSPDAIERLAAAIPTATLLRLPRSKHEPMFERDSIRDLFLAATEAFYSIPELRERNLKRSLENFDVTLL